MSRHTALAIAEPPFLPGFKVGELIDGWRLSFRGPNPMRPPDKPPCDVFKFEKLILGHRALSMLALAHEHGDDDAWTALRVSLRMAELELLSKAPTQGNA